MFLIFLICSVGFQEPAAAQDECGPTSCSSSGPIVRFPFRLKGRQPEHCGYPGFDLSCNRNNITEFEFQFPVRASARNIVLPISAKATVRNIDYSLQVIGVDVVNGSCLPNRVPDVSASASPFELHYRFSYDPSSMGYTLFNCSREPDSVNQASGPISCLQHGAFQVYAYRSSYTVTDFPMSNCAKMYNVSDIAMAILIGPREYSFDGPQLHWSEPSCGNCESNGKYCSWKNNQTECFDVPKPKQPQPQPQHNKNGTPRILLISPLVSNLHQFVQLLNLNLTSIEKIFLILLFLFSILSKNLFIIRFIISYLHLNQIK